MAEVDIDPFGDHDKTGTQPKETGETIPLIPGGVIRVGGGATWEPEQEMSFGGVSIRAKVIREHVEGLY